MRGIPIRWPAGFWMVCSTIVNHVRNLDNKGRDLAGVPCTELVGDPAVYTPAGGDPADTRCFVIHDAPFIGDLAKRTWFIVPGWSCPLIGRMSEANRRPGDYARR